MPSADQVPVKNPHPTMRWHKWVVLTAGSTGSALRAVRPPNLHITPAVRRDLVYAASATAVTFVGRRANNAVSEGRCLTSALVRENPQLRRHEVITGRHPMFSPPLRRWSGHASLNDCLGPGGESDCPCPWNFTAV